MKARPVYDMDRQLSDLMQMFFAMRQGGQDGQDEYDENNKYDGHNKCDSHDRHGDKQDAPGGRNDYDRPEKHGFSGEEQMHMAPMFFMMLENMMPYLPPPQQKNVASMLRLMELRQRFTEYADEAARKHTPYGPDWRIDLLKSMRQHLPAKKQRMIDIMVKMIEIQVLIRVEEAGYGN